MHEGITLIIAVYTGTAERETETGRERGGVGWVEREGEKAVGCSPVWLPVTVKCSSL